MRTSRYVSSVPILTRQWLVEGYIWQCQAVLEQVPNGAEFIAVLPDSRSLIATAKPVSPEMDGRIFTPWPVEIYSKEDQQIPLAVLDNLGHYAQIESFTVPLDEEPEITPASALPSYCSFRCGQTDGVEHLCPD